jgi:hypothetical protein
MACDPSLSEVVLAGLPSMFVVNITNDSAGQWLANSIQFSVREAGGPGTGTDVVLAKLSEVLFIETLRRFIQDLPDQQKGWLAGARDPVIGEALALLHKNPAALGPSRSSPTKSGFRARDSLSAFDTFWASLLWRISHGGGASWLRKYLGLPMRNVGEIAAEIGYASEAAFDRVFKAAIWTSARAVPPLPGGTRHHCASSCRRLCRLN